MTCVTRLACSGAALALVVAVAAPAGALPSYGHTRAADGRLRDGCHNYRYTFVVDTPTDDWSLETFLRDPRGKPIASGVFLSDSEPNKGKATFRLCRYATRAGTFTIRAKVSWYDAYNVEHRGKLEPSHFRLVRR